MQNNYYLGAFHQTQLRPRQTAVSIRSATAADAHIIAEMGHRLVAAAHANALPATDMNRYLNRAFNVFQVKDELRQPDNCFYLAEENQNVAGMVKISAGFPPVAGLGQRPVELSRLYLNPNWIGKGVGTALVQHVLSQAKSTGHDICWLMVWTGNHRAIKFYRRWRFAIADKINFPTGHSNLPAYLMLRTIS